jgi:serine/threonine protein kinase
MKWSDFTIERPLGSGGMASVFLAHTADGQRFALKRLQKGFTPDFKKRLEREAEIQRKLGHCPNIVRCYDLFEHDGQLVLVLEYVDGPNLMYYVNQGFHDYERGVRWLQQMLVALSAAHSLGVVHRDVKPANILIAAKGHAVLTDFGIARVRDSQLTKGYWLGTEYYMSPEQPRGHTCPASDLYSLGLTFYELFTKTVPKDKTGAVPPIKTRVHNVPDQLARVIDRCVQPQLDRRYREAAEALCDLQTCVGFDSAAQVPMPDGKFAALAQFMGDVIKRLKARFVSPGMLHPSPQRPRNTQLSRLTVFVSGRFHSEYQLGRRPFWIGRDADACDLFINADAISRRHACLRPDVNGVWHLEDHSLNGTFYQGKLIGKGGKVRLQPGDGFRCCRTLDVKCVVE